MPGPPRDLLVSGATGFVGRALMPELVRAGHRVRATTRRLRPGLEGPAEWVEVDLSRPDEVAPVLDGVDVAYFLVHGMASAREDYAETERRSAASFARAAELAGVSRLVYLGGVAPRGRPSKHLASRLAVGEVLRAGRVPALELRASMIVGPGSTSWQVVRDLALRLPVMVLPSWVRSRSCPVWIGDVVGALVAAIDLPLEGSTWFDLPGPDVLTVRQIFEHVAALRDRALPAIWAPLPAPRVSSIWLKFVCDADWRVVRELVLGLSHDLLPRDARYWQLANLPPPIPFDEAARRALEADRPARAGLGGAIARLEEELVQRFAPSAKPARSRTRRAAGAGPIDRPVTPAARSRRSPS
jgi:uncharacterized protein YbjT (DUF2867 family)